MLSQRLIAANQHPPSPSALSRALDIDTEVLAPVFAHAVDRKRTLYRTPIVSVELFEDLERVYYFLVCEVRLPNTPSTYVRIELQRRFTPILKLADEVEQLCYNARSRGARLTRREEAPNHHPKLTLRSFAALLHVLCHKATLRYEVLSQKCIIEVLLLCICRRYTSSWTVEPEALSTYGDGRSDVVTTSVAMEEATHPEDSLARVGNVEPIGMLDDLVRSLVDEWERKAAGY